MKQIHKIRAISKSYVGVVLTKATGVTILPGRKAGEAVRLEMPTSVVAAEFTTGLFETATRGELTIGVTGTGLEATPDVVVETEGTVVDACSVDESGVADASTISDCVPSVTVTISECDPLIAAFSASSRAN